MAHSEFTLQCASSNCCVHRNVLHVCVQVLWKLTSGSVSWLCLQRNNKFVSSRTLTDVAALLESKGPKQWEARDWRFGTSVIKEKYLYKILKKQICRGKRKDFSRGQILYNLKSCRSKFSHALRKLEKELTEYRDIWIYFGGFVRANWRYTAT